MHSKVPSRILPSSIMHLILLSTRDMALFPCFSGGNISISTFNPSIKHCSYLLVGGWWVGMLIVGWSITSRWGLGAGWGMDIRKSGGTTNYIALWLWLVVIITGLYKWPSRDAWKTWLSFRKFLRNHQWRSCQCEWKWLSHLEGIWTGRWAIQWDLNWEFKKIISVMRVALWNVSLFGILFCTTWNYCSKSYIFGNDYYFAHSARIKVVEHFYQLKYSQTAIQYQVFSYHRK